MKVFLLGCGSIGRYLATAAAGMEAVDEILIYDNHPEEIAAFVESLSKGRIVDTLEHISEAELVVEAASQEAAREVLPLALEMGKDVMVLSVGALVDDGFRRSCQDLALRNGGRFMVPSGAVCGVDGLRSAAVEDLDSVELISTKGPRSLDGAPYIVERGIDVHSIKERTELFRGSARDAVRLFPKNVNVAATVSLLGLGFDRTMVTVVLDPDAEENRHQLLVRGAFGSLCSETRNLPFPENPATSHLAALSAAAALRRIVDNQWIGV